MVTLPAFAQTISQTLDIVLGPNGLHGIVLLISFLTKAYVLYAIIKQFLSHKNTPQRAAFILLFFMLLGACCDDLAWLVKVAQRFFMPDLSYTWATLIIRLAWLTMAIGWHSLTLLLEYLASPHQRIRMHQKIFLVLTSILVLCYVYFIIFHFFVFSKEQKSLFEFELMQITTYYCLVMLIPSIACALKKIYLAQLPRILTRQLNTLLLYFVVPLFLTETYHALNAYYFSLLPTPSYTFTTVYTLLTTAAIYYCARTMVFIRFLNFYPHVHGSGKFGFVNQEILEQLSATTSHEHVSAITKTFFKQTFGIATQNTHFNVRMSHETQHITTHTPTGKQITVEHFIAQITTQKNNMPLVQQYVQENRVLIFDELEFNYFYEPIPAYEALVTFMRTLNADIFIPLYEQQEIIGYIYIDRAARTHELYNDLERDSMLIFSRLVAHTCTLLHHSHLTMLISQNKQLHDTLYQKHQELAHCKESLQSFIADERTKKIGIVYYKNRTFTCANQDAHDLLMINPTIQQGHPMSHALRNVVRNVQLYKTTQTTHVTNDHAQQLVLSALPTTDAHTILVIVHYPHVADILAQHTWHIKEPSEWDYQLYLETTAIGKLINKALPGTSPTFVRTKIQLLRCALSKRALFLDAPEEDLETFAQLLHHVSMRETLHVLDAHLQAHELVIKLFGINPLFGKQTHTPLLEELNCGTLLIKNIHAIDRQTQEHMLHYLTYGTYRSFKSAHELTTDVRILCATRQDLKQLVNDGRFIAPLYELLHQESVNIPSLLSVNEQEFNQIIDDMMHTTTTHEQHIPTVHLSDSEKNKLHINRPTSVYELKKTIQQLLTAKSARTALPIITKQPIRTTDPFIIQAAHLGRRALKDAQLMAQLWKKFKNQNKIATVLGVHRSSVNKRCKKYNLT